MPPDAYSIADLARLTGLNVRTIRYYIAQGLIPASGESGPGAHYGNGHLDRLILTRRLQQQHLPLAEIRTRLASLSDADVTSLVAAPEDANEPEPTSALEYVRGLLGQAEGLPVAHPAAPPSPTFAGPAPAAPPAHGIEPPPRFVKRSGIHARSAPIAEPHASPDDERVLASLVEPPPFAEEQVAVSEVPARLPRSRYEASAVAMPRMRDAPEASVASGRRTTPPPVRRDAAAGTPRERDAATPERSQWERHGLGPNIELHVRRPLSRVEQRRVERLITIARQVLKEDGV
jgi:DNA-binding transcriptional MerR regulator